MVRILNKEDILKILPDREVCSHKGDFGKILLLCGSLGYTGAPALSAMGALRSGAGLVYMGVPQSIYQIEAIKLNEPVIYPLKDCEGRLCRDSLSQICDLLPKMDAVLLGPGLGQSQELKQVVHAVLRAFKGPLVLDADGINAICGHMDVLREREGVTILTPHEGEFKRLGVDMSVGRKESAVRFAREYHSILLLKGHETVITDGETVYVNPTGNPGMAVGGCGDLLAGIITSFLGQRIDPLLAAACGAWVHGAAGDLCAAEIGQYGMLPTDMASALPRLLK